MREALGLVESAWFFRRGAQTMRIIRVGRRNSKATLRVEGPGAARITHHFDDHLSCAIQQCEIERQLTARDFYLEQIGRTRG
jgi:hypothetical protein